MKAARRNSRIVQIAYFGAVCSTLAVAQPAAKAPEIPAPLATKLFKAQAENATARLEYAKAGQTLQQKDAALQAVVTELQKACGEKFQPQMNAAGDPACVAKLEAPAKEKAK